MIHPATAQYPPTRIVIVGGTSGGLSCAARARRLDESVEIIVLDRGTGVSFGTRPLPAPAGNEDDVEELPLAQSPARLRATLALDVRIGHDVVAVDPTAKQVRTRVGDRTAVVRYDALVLAPEVITALPDIAGISSPRVRAVCTVDEASALGADLDAGAERAVVIGEGLLGLECSDALTRRGISTTLIQSGTRARPSLDPVLTWPVSEELSRVGVTVRADARAERIERGRKHDTVVLADGSRLIADLVVVAASVRADIAVFEKAGVITDDGVIITDEYGRTLVPNVWALGQATRSIDSVTGVCHPVALTDTGNRAGRFVADQILRPASARALSSGTRTEVVRVGELTVATAGADRAELAAARVAFMTLRPQPLPRVVSSPGTPRLAVHVRVADRLVLGAQMVGVDGVAERLDVLAAAICNRMKVDDLHTLDLGFDVDAELAVAGPNERAEDAVRPTPRGSEPAATSPRRAARLPSRRSARLSMTGASTP